MYDCAVPGCKAKGVHNFPRNEHLRRLWEIAAKTSESKIYNPTRVCKICTVHFKPDNYFKEGYYTGVKNKKRVLKKGVVPSRFPWNTKKKSLLKRMGILVEKKEVPKTDGDNTEAKAGDTPDANTSTVTQQCKTEKMDVDQPATDPLALPTDNTVGNVKQECTTSQNQENTNEANSTATTSEPESKPTFQKIENVSITFSEIPTSPEVKITETQILQAMQAECKLDKTQMRLDKQKTTQQISMEHFKDNNAQVLSHTGIESFEKLVAIFETLGPEVYFLQSRRNVISADDQYFLTLMKLRQNIDDDKLGKLFNIKPAVVSNVFITWINFLYEKWKMIKLTPEEVEILVSPADYLTQDQDKSDNQNNSTNKKGGKKEKKAKKKDTKKSSRVLPPVPDTLPEGVASTYPILLSTENIKHLSRPKLYLVCKILCCFIDNTINPFVCRNQI